MKISRKHTRAVKFIADDLLSAENIDETPQAQIDAYLEKNGMIISDLDLRLNKFAKSLDMQLAMARAEAECVRKKAQPERKSDYSSLSESQLLELLHKRFGGAEQLPLAARTKKKLTRRDLECLLEDSEDEE